MRFVPIFIIIMCVATVTSGNVIAGDLGYYYAYTKNTQHLIKTYTDLEKKCTNAFLLECSDLEVHARNIIIQRASSYQEYSKNVIGNFVGTFPNTVLPSVLNELDQHDANISQAKYLATFAQPSLLPELEVTMNRLLLKNKGVLEVLSSGFHYRKVTEMHKAVSSLYENIEKEKNAAKSIGLDTVLVEKYLMQANASLKLAETHIKKASIELDEHDGKSVPNDVTASILAAYGSVQDANDNLLKASQVLLRLAERGFWQIE